VTVVSRWLIDLAFAAPPQSGLAWFCFLFPLIEPDRQISRIRLWGVGTSLALNPVIMDRAADHLINRFSTNNAACTVECAKWSLVIMARRVRLRHSLSAYFTGDVFATLAGACPVLSGIFAIRLVML
jgi:hypothetical protein